MPRGDSTGPAGMGPMTGRAAGYCAGYGTPGFANPVRGRGLGAWGGGAWGARGGGRGYRNWYYATGLPGWARTGCAPAWGAVPYQAPGAPTAEQETDALRAEAENLRSMLQNIEKRLQEIQEQPE